MAEGKILLANLARSTLGEDTAALLGALFASSAGLEALSLPDAP